MIDYEFRIVTPTVRSLIKKSSTTEPILIKKIPKKNISKKYIYKIYFEYLKKAKLLKSVFYRGLPLNLSKNYFKQEFEIEETYKNLINECKSNIKGKRIIQIPNPDYVNFTNFENLVSKVEKFSGFELISSWHKKKTSDKSYKKFFEFVQNSKLPLSIEVDYFYRNSFNNIHYFFDIIKKYPKIRYWLPHFGCGIFLHWEKIVNTCNHKPLILTSADKSLNWLEIFKLRKFRNIPLRFASDHPFNNLNSIKIYNEFIKFKK